jgi:hypothetical protein
MVRFASSIISGNAASSILSVDRNISPILLALVGVAILMPSSMAAIRNNLPRYADVNYLRAKDA